MGKKLILEHYQKIGDKTGATVLSPASHFEKPATEHKRKMLVRCPCGKEHETVMFKWNGLCGSCNHKAAKGDVITGLTLKNLLDAEKYILKSSIKDYKNTKTQMSVLCPRGHELEVSYYSFKTRGSRCITCFYADKKPSIETIGHEFAIRGGTLLSTVFVNGHALLDYICKCGRQMQISYFNLLKNTVGCTYCRIASHRLDRSYAEDFTQKQGCELMTTEEEYKNNLQRLLFKCVCFVLFETSWKGFCNGVRCEACSKRKKAETCLSKYGFDNPSKAPEIKAKIDATHQKNFGKKRASALPEYNQKASATNKANHGGIHNLALPEMRVICKAAMLREHGGFGAAVPSIREKIIATNQDRLGVDFPLNSEKVQKTIKENNLKVYGNEVFLQSDVGKALMKEKYGAEFYVQSMRFLEQMIELCGQTCFLHSTAFTALMIERYGVPHAMQCPELFEKAMKGGLREKDFVLPSGKIVRVQGYEDKAIRGLLEEYEEDEIQYQYSSEGKRILFSVPYIDDKGGKHIYYPDLYIPSIKTIVEVKSPYWYERDMMKNWQKFDACVDQGYNVMLLVYNAKELWLTIEYSTDRVCKEWCCDEYSEYDR